MGMTDSTAGAQEARRVRDASGNAAELHGNDGSDVRTDTERKDVYAGQDLFRPIPEPAGYWLDCLVNKGLRVRVPPPALFASVSHFGL